MSFTPQSVAPQTAILLVGFLTLACTVQARAEDPALEAAHQRVWAFEQPLVKQVIELNDDEQLKATAAFQQPIRDFFAALDSREMKLAALGMLNSRYVYVVNRELAAELLGPLIRDPDPAVRAEAAQAIGYQGCGTRYAKELIAMLDGEPSADTLASVVYAMGGSRDKAFAPHLQGLLDHGQEKVRATALQHFTRLQPEAAFAMTVEALRDTSPWVRKIAVQNLTQWPKDQSAPRAQELLIDEQPDVRERAVWTLGQLQSSESAAQIAQRLTDDNNGVRGRAAVVLGDLKAVEHADAVAALLADGNVVARRYAVMGLGRMGQPKYLDQLRPLLNDADEQVRKYAAESIAMLEAVEEARNESP